MKAFPKGFALMVALTASALLGLAEEKKGERLSVELQLVRYAEAKRGVSSEWLFLMRGVAFRSVEELKRGIARLPKGSEVVWNPGCVTFGGEPLRSDAELSDLKRYCASIGIVLRIIPSG